MFGDFPRNVWGHFPECLTTFPGIYHSGHSPRSPNRVSRSCISGFIHSRKERLNRELKTEELVDYRKFSLSELLKVAIESFFPSFYHHYVELNSRYSDEYKKYQRQLAKKHHRSLINHKRSSWPCNDQVGGTYQQDLLFSEKFWLNRIKEEKICCWIWQWITLLQLHMSRF